MNPLLALPVTAGTDLGEGRADTESHRVLAGAGSMGTAYRSDSGHSTNSPLKQTHQEVNSGPSNPVSTWRTASWSLLQLPQQADRRFCGVLTMGSLALLRGEEGA